jgi:hypothetical protein
MVFIQEWKARGIEEKGRMSIWRNGKLKVSEVDKQTNIGSYILKFSKLQ